MRSTKSRENFGDNCDGRTEASRDVQIISGEDKVCNYGIGIKRVQKRHVLNNCDMEKKQVNYDV